MTVCDGMKLLRRRQQGTLRQLSIEEGHIDFSSNDYLGLARSNFLAVGVKQELEVLSPCLNKLGATGSRLLTGNSLYAQELEEKIARFHGFEAGLLFNCGYMANLGLIQAVADSGSIIFFDAAVHASTHDGICLSRAKAYAFRHNDLSHLEYRLKQNCFVKRCFVCIESIYSTDGSRASLTEMCCLAEKYGAYLIVDEAHAVGIYGPQGRGLVEEEGLSSQVFAKLVTFGKSIGTFGAIVLGTDLLKQHLINFARSFIYTTAMPVHMLVAIKCSYELFPKLEAERKHLQDLIKIFRSRLISSSNTHIQPVRIRGNENVKKMAVEIVSRGFDVRALLSPTVRRGEEMLRICLHAFNRKEEVIKLLDQLESIKGKGV